MFVLRSRPNDKASWGTMVRSCPTRTLNKSQHSQKLNPEGKAPDLFSLYRHTVFAYDPAANRPPPQESAENARDEIIPRCPVVLLRVLQVGRASNDLPGSATSNTRIILLYPAPNMPLSVRLEPFRGGEEGASITKLYSGKPLRVPCGTRSKQLNLSSGKIRNQNTHTVSSRRGDHASASN